MPIQGPKITFWGVFIPLNITLYYRDPQTALPDAETRVLSPHWSLSVLRCDLEVVTRIQNKETPESKPKFAPFADPSPSPHVDQILCGGSYPGYISWFGVSERSVGKCRSCRGRSFGLAIDKAHRLYNSLLLPHKPWQSICSEAYRL